MREDPSKRRGPGAGSWSIVTWLIVINGVIFVIDRIMSGALSDWFGLSLTGLAKGKIWTPLTYQFTHGSVMHILFNMVGVFFFGRTLLMMTSARLILKLYLLGGLVGGAFQLLFSLLMSDGAHIVGASGSVLALLFAVVALLPNQPMRLIFPPVTITPRIIVIFILVINSLTLLMQIVAPNPTRTDTAVMAHFGGMLLGWWYMKYRYQGNQGRYQNGRKKKRSKFAEKFGIRIIPREEQEKAKRGASAEPFVNDEVDAILDKINEHGFQSLTKEEKKKLDRSSEKLSDRKKRNS
jgi:membrane associated rhomboid family serine protease